MPARVAEVQVSVIETDVLIHAIVAFFFPSPLMFKIKPQRPWSTVGFAGAY
jgi:hypothetical protein